MRALPRRLALVGAAAALALTGLTATAPAQQAHASTTTPAAANAIHFALAQLGKPYKWGATGPYSYDCSGLTQASYHAAGINIPRVSRYQYHSLPKVGRHYWRPGDLIFYAYNTHDWTTIHHVAIYLGAGWMLDAPHTGTVVKVEPVHSGLMWYAARPGGSSNRRMLNIWPSTRGNSMRDLQVRLRANGYGIDVTGVYDAATSRAVDSVRARYGLSDSRSVGWLFWHVLVANGVHTHRS